MDVGLVSGNFFALVGVRPERPVEHRSRIYRRRLAEVSDSQLVDTDQ